MSVLKWITFIALLLVSGFFTVNLALDLGTTQMEKGVLVGGAVAIEALKAYTLISAKTAAFRKAWFRATGMYAAYGFVAIYSLTACAGYALATVERMRAATTVLGHEVSVQSELAALRNLDEQIGVTRSLISQRQAALSTMEDPAQRSLARKFIADGLARMDGYQTRKDSATQRIEAWRSEDQTARARTRQSLYLVMGQALHLDPERIAFVVLAVFALAIEMGIFLTSPHGAAEQGKARTRRPAKASLRAPSPWRSKLLAILTWSPLPSTEAEPDRPELPPPSPNAVFRRQEPVPQQPLMGLSLSD